MKRILIFLLILIMAVVAFTACGSNEEEIEEMDMNRKLWYAQNIDFTLQVYSYNHGEWLQGRSGDFYGRVRYLIIQDNELSTDLYTEVRFVLHPDEAADIPTNIILAFPTEDTVARAVNAFNWEVDSAGIDLSEYDLSYPITVTNLVDDYEKVDRLLNHDSNFRLMIHAFARDLVDRIGGTRIDFELMQLSEHSEDNVETVLAILEKLNMTQDEAGPILRAAGSMDVFIAVTDIMLTQGLSAEEALARVT